MSKPFRIPELVPKIEELMDRFPAPEALKAQDISDLKIAAV